MGGLMPTDIGTAMIGAGAVLAGGLVTQSGILLNERRRRRAEAQRFFHSQRQSAYADYISWCEESRRSLEELEKLQSQNQELGQKLEKLNNDWQSEPITLKLPGGEE